MTKTKIQATETNAETSQENTETTETELRHDVETIEEDDKTAEEGYVSPTVLNEMIHLRLDEGLSFREIAKRKKVSLSMTGRVLKGVNSSQAENQSDVDGKGLGGSSPTFPSTITPGVSQNLIPEPSELGLGPLANEPPEMMSDIELNLEEKRLKREMNIKRLRAKNAWLDHMTRHPEGYSSGWNDHDGHGSRDDETIKDLRQEVRQLAQAMQNNPLGYMKLGVDAFKSGVDAVPKAQGVDPTTLFTTYRAGIQDARENLLATSQVQDNEYSVRKEILRQEERLDTRKIDLEEKKWQYEQEHSGDTVKAVTDIAKTVFEGPVGKFVESLGAGAADRIRGKGNLKQIQCPACNGKFNANPSLVMVTCVHCGARLEKQQEPTSQPKPEPQPEAEAASTPKEPEPRIVDVSSDAEEPKTEPEATISKTEP